MKRAFSGQIPVTADLLRIMVDLEARVKEQERRLEESEQKAAQMEKHFKILVKELIDGGYINVPERRKMLRRSIISQDALINLLTKKGLVSKRELLKEIRHIVQQEKRLKIS